MCKIIDLFTMWLHSKNSARSYFDRFFYVVTYDALLKPDLKIDGIEMLKILKRLSTEIMKIEV